MTGLVRSKAAMDNVWIDYIQRTLIMRYKKEKVLSSYDGGVYSE